MPERKTKGAMRREAGGQDEDIWWKGSGITRLGDSDEHLYGLKVSGQALEKP